MQAYKIFYRQPTTSFLIGAIVRTVGFSIATMHYRYAGEIVAGEFALRTKITQLWHN